MRIDHAAIELTPEQMERLAAIAERTGKDYRTVVDELLCSASFLTSDAHGSREGAAETIAYGAFLAADAIGCCDLPADLSNNPKCMEGFGLNARRRDAD